ncbi:GNAT family N-acetyltransferase [Yersinia sp. 2540 StPb PI]|uniref:GNAT family N-acetyltransferase n=1 Tax=Yersinia sp. 2540 StPb PI TaxID=3117406 RepID=UPI003FA465EF
MIDSCNWYKENYLISTDPSLLDIDAIHHALFRSTWAQGIDRETVKLSVNNSLCFGLYAQEIQIGFARLVTDYATFAYLCDVYIIDGYQQSGLGLWLIECVNAHPLIPRLRRIMLVTDTAAWLYPKVGYVAVNRPDFVWQIVKPDIYLQR